MGLFQNLRKNIFGRSTISLYSRGFGVLTRLDAKRSLHTYRDNLIVYSAIKKRAEKVGQVEFQLFRGKREVSEHPILDLLEKPNNWQTKAEFFELYQTMKDLTGSVFVWKYGNKNGMPESLYILRSDRMKIKTDSEGEISSYEYQLDTTKAITFEPEDIFFSQHSDPLNYDKFIGQPIPLAGSPAIESYRQLDEYQENVLRNGGKVEGIIKIPADSLSKEELERLQEQWSAERAGADKAGIPMFTYGGMEYQDIGQTPKELSFNDSKSHLRDDIIMLFGVPKVLLAQTENVNYGSAEIAHRIFLRETIKPLLDNLVTKLNFFLVPEPYDLRYIDPTPEDTELKLKEIDSGMKFNYLTPNEARQMMGYDPIEGGDSLRSQPSIEEMLMIEPNNEEEPETRTIRKTNEWRHPLTVKEVRDVYRREVRAKQDRDELRFTRELRKYTAGQEKRIIEYIEAGPKNWKHIKEVEGAKKNIIDDAFNSSVELQIGNELFRPLMNALALEAGKDVMEMFGLDITYNFSDTLRTTLEKRVHFFVREINHTTFIKLQDAFEQSLQEGENRRQLIKRIQGVYENYDEVRARTIARTETHTAVQQANLDAYRQANIPTKVWVAVVDDVTRDSHLAIDGEEVPRESTFSNGLMMAGDPNGAPEEVINCRCSS